MIQYWLREDINILEGQSISMYAHVTTKTWNVNGEGTLQLCIIV